LNGKILYHVTTAIDNQKGILVNTGDPVFSGTIAGSEPVLRTLNVALVVALTSYGSIAAGLAASIVLPAVGFESPPLRNVLCAAHWSIVLRIGTNSIMTSGVAG
jgi:hypothetical protein